MAKQIVYHGSYCKVDNPQIRRGKYTKDFGIGFYCTILEEQAKKWADKYETHVLNIYEYDENPNLKIKEFTVMTEEWLDFIIDFYSKFFYASTNSYNSIISQEFFYFTYHILN